MTAQGTIPRPLLAFAAALLTTTTAQAIPLLDGFGGPTGYGTPDHCVAPNDDGGYSGPTGTGYPEVAIDLTPAFPTGLSFFGATYNTFYLNTNGNITFRGALGTYTPSAFPVAMQPMIAPYWADVDTRGGGQPSQNSICYHVEPNRVVVTWHNVGYFGSHNDHLNDFQLVLSTSNTCTTGGDFDVEFRYNRCEWTTGDASGGMGGRGGTPAQIGFDAGDSSHYVALPNSRTADIINVCNQTNVSGGSPGLFRFQIRGGMVGGGCTGAAMSCNVTGQMGACADGVTICAGMGTTCRQVNMPRARACNGFDNDCDGTVDEGNDLCASNQVCDRGQCVDRCQPELGCLAGRTCSDRGTCVETTCLTVTCPSGQRCADGRCIAVCDGVVCPHAQVCRAGRCVNPCDGVVCDGRDVCDGDPTSTSFGQCIPGCQCVPCAMGRTCQPDGFCSDDLCVGITCPTGTYCQAGMCLDSCATGPDTILCPAGEVCQLGQCIPGAHPIPMSDAGTSVDGSVPTGDGGADAGRDAGRPRDAGTNDVVTADRPETGTSTGTGSLAPSDRGCSCRVGARDGANRSVLGLAALGAFLGLRRRRRANPS